MPAAEACPPLVPAEVDLTDFPFMPVMIARLKQSRAWLNCKRKPELAFYMWNLWTAAWHARPAASLEADDDVLADLAMCEPRAWAKVKGDVLRGWVTCTDGRLYHPVVAEQALSAWARKTAQRGRTEAARLARLTKRQSHTLKGSVTTSVTEVATENATENVTGHVTQSVTSSKGQGEGQGQYSALTGGAEPGGLLPFRSVLGEQPASETMPRPPDPTAAERDLYARGKEVLGEKAGGQITKLVKAKGSIALARSAIETASTKHNPQEYIAGAIRGDNKGRVAGQLYDPSI